MQLWRTDAQPLANEASPARPSLWRLGRQEDVYKRQKYYRVVMAISELNDLIIQHFEEVILPCEQPVQIQPLNSRFQLRDGYIEVTHPNVFKRTPFALLEIFVLMAQHPEIKGVRADTIRDVYKRQGGCRSRRACAPRGAGPRETAPSAR